MITATIRHVASSIGFIVGEIMIMMADTWALLVDRLQSPTGVCVCVCVRESK